VGEAAAGDLGEDAPRRREPPTSAHPVDRIAAQVGFGSPTAFRERFKRVVGTSPHAYRIAFRGQNS